MRKIRIGDIVKWNDPGIDEFPAEDRQDQLDQLFEVIRIDGDIITIHSEYSEAEVFESELIKCNILTDADIVHTARDIRIYAVPKTRATNRTSLSKFIKKAEEYGWVCCLSFLIKQHNNQAPAVFSDTEEYLMRACLKINNTLIEIPYK